MKSRKLTCHHATHLTGKNAMKAAVNTEYGSPDVLQVREVEKPTPINNELLIRIYATSVSSGDWKMRKADPFLIRLFFGLFKPKKTVLGYVLAGEIENTGKDVTQFKKGEKIYATTGMNFGAYAEYICLPEKGVIATKPDSLSYEEAAAIPFGGNTALYFLRKGGIQSGQKILICGASGAIGTAAVQLAKHFGAEVTAVCSTANLAMVQSLGADKVIDYTQEDFTKYGELFDIVFDTVGKSSYSDCMRVLKPTGRLVLSAAGLKEMFKGLWANMTSSKKVISGVMSETADDLLFFNNLLSQGKFKAVIDTCYPLEDIAKAHRYVEKGHKKGNVIISIIEC